MASTEKLNTHQKALRINLDPTSYGSFAEILGPFHPMLRFNFSQVELLL